VLRKALQGRMQQSRAIYWSRVHSLRGSPLVKSATIFGDCWEWMASRIQVIPISTSPGHWVSITAVYVSQVSFAWFVRHTRESYSCDVIVTFSHSNTVAVFGIRLADSPNRTRTMSTLQPPLIQSRTLR